MFSLNNLGLTNILSNLASLTTQLAVSNERIATGYKVNRASDDPSGIVSINNFNAQIARIDAAASSGTRINNIIDTADGAMSTIETHLTTIETAVTSASGDPGNLEAYQATIDTALDAIDALVNTTKYNGTTLLNGGIGYTASDVDTDDIDLVRVHSADTTGGSLTVEVTKVDGGFTVNGKLFETVGTELKYRTGNTAIDITVDAAFAGTTSFTVTGDGADWALGNSSAERIFFGQPSLSTSVLGDNNTGLLSSLKSGGANDMDSGNFIAAGNVVDLAQGQLSGDRARIGGIKSYAVTATLNAYDNTKDELEDAVDYIKNINSAEEIIENTRLELLIEAGAAIISSMTSHTNTVLVLLGLTTS